jgi:hypothetical protein
MENTVMKELFLKDINMIKDKSKLNSYAPQLGKDFKEMVNGTFGEEIVDVGLAMLGYLFDIFESDFDKGMSACTIFYSGYPNLEHSDLFTPYYDVLSTRRLWIQASKKLNLNNHIHNSLIMNTYFRWYSSTFELFRKMLIFDCYCLGLKTGHQINIINYLFRSKDPSNKLRNEGPKDRLRLLEFYNSTIRHSISHGNILVIPEFGVVIRESSNDKEKFIQKKYKGPEEFIEEVTPNIEIMCGAIRFFYFIISAYLFPKYSTLFKKYFGSYFTDEVLVAMVLSIQKNTVDVIY